MVCNRCTMLAKTELELLGLITLTRGHNMKSIINQ